MRKSIVVKCRDLVDRFALGHTVAKIKEKYYFPKMRSMLNITFYRVPKAC